VTDSETIAMSFSGCLLGAALGDAVGARREGGAMGSEREIAALIDDSSFPLIYTDDTHMTIGVAESLIDCGGFDGAHMAQRFVSNHAGEPWRGYGPGPPRVFSLIRGGEPWDTAANLIYRGGSFGNGAAMRVSPVGLLFWDRPEELKRVAHLSSLITHSHALGMQGALLQALAVARAVACGPDRQLDAAAFVSHLLTYATEDVYHRKMGRLSILLEHPNDRHLVIAELGHGIEAFNSVPTAIFSFLSHPGDFAATVAYAVSLGGDTDTIASMAGAIAGACLGVDALPSSWLDRLENRDYIAHLAGRLWQLASADS